ncbi:hypothetical protein L861_15915 [Litchfieldella anticariensis FP35 = DSM 16096]|uniref:Lipid/polyisoprenoid-binding YceI-like domain-containing protein n=1 Tax=Litchfieldella anticariensis (strain DSM 16096 / CECT 5854 / CIP 108499 / LMG 22089 / FP35) TaxID=1121939 RepID=S2L371_LITA3|nr:hypothetical protein [Halomonas anticariensis]EPC02194.1 hypothetical protein L861_15915 [Halomonas anticariensis FP35 = DSM 16096]
MKAYLAIVPLLLSLPAQAAWQLDPAQSRLEATVVEITPNGPVPHQHQLRELRGDISPEGTLRLPLRLNQTDVLDRLGELPPWLSGVKEMTLATLVTQLPPERLDALGVGESMTETLMFRIQSEDVTQQEPLKLRFTRHTHDEIQVTNAERVALDGRELMANQTARSVMLLLGYEQIGDEVPVQLDATLIDR